MATFESKIHALQIEPHPNADRLELAAIGGYRCVVPKGRYEPGDLAAYIPEGAIVPDAVIAELGLEGRLAGPQKNRVKAIRLRGTLSQGLVYPARGEKLRATGVQEGDDVTEALGLVKYEPPIPIHMQGEVDNARGRTVKYDIEDVKKFPGVLRDGEEVVMTEKLHGTWCCLGWHPEHGPIVTSKGLSARGLVFKLNEANENNLYVRAWRAHRAELEAMFGMDTQSSADPFYVLGEIHGRGVQDLHYGLANPGFRVFDIRIGRSGSPHARYLDVDDLRRTVAEHLPMVPVLYRGPFSQAAMLRHTTGATSLGGGHIREGVVIRPVRERMDPDLGRVLLKSVSGDYLTRRRKRPKR